MTRKKIAGRLNLFLTLALAAAVPSAAGIYFESSWNMATGNSEMAVTDGYRFTQTAGTNLLKVETGGVAGNNLMGIWLNGQQFAHSMVSQLPIQDYPDFYYRFYVRVYPKNGISYPNYHGIENLDQSYASNFYFSIRDQGDPNSWTCHVGSYAAQPEGMDQHYMYAGGLSFNVWYRIEGHIHWYNHADWAAPVTWKLRVYDANNNLVFDEGSMKGWSTGVSMKDYFSQGKRLYLNGKTNTWTMGNNGPAGGTGQGRIHDVSCFALGNDASVWGPVTTKLPQDNLKPIASNFFPAANATNVSAGTVINMTLKDAGFGLDSSSIVLKVNGVAVKANRSGSVWSSSLFYKPPVSFPAGAKVSVELNATDKASPANVMAPVVYSFQIAGTPSVHQVQPLSSALAPKQVLYNLLGQREVRFNKSGSPLGAMRIVLTSGSGETGNNRMLAGK